MYLQVTCLEIHGLSRTTVLSAWQDSRRSGYMICSHRFYSKLGFLARGTRRLCYCGLDGYYKRYEGQHRNLSSMPILNGVTLRHAFDLLGKVKLEEVVAVRTATVKIFAFYPYYKEECQKVSRILHLSRRCSRKHIWKQSRKESSQMIIS